VTEDGDRDYWMSAQEAKDYGLIDNVLVPGEMKKPGDKA
jgi:ATP-dependent Clp protease protease subunit